jgi:hypothetical protein
MSTAPLILFGAFDRHNLGDILLAHVAAAESAPRPVVFAGLAARDLTPLGGQRVRAIADLARAWGGARADVLHVGGELLTCNLYQAAVMLQSGVEARAAIARFDADPAAGMAWAQTTLGLRQRVAYLVPKRLFRNPGRFEIRAAGGVDLPSLPPEMRGEVWDRLSEADVVSARDRVTLEHLAKIGVGAALEADPANRAPVLFAARIRAHAGRGEPAAVHDAFPQGWLAVQFAAEYGDDASLARLADHLDGLLAQRGLGLVLFRAGAAPWHDDAAVYRRLTGFMKHRRIRLFKSLDVWDICALLAGARGYCGSSLHGWILGRAFGVECLPFPLPLHSAKLAAYAATWGADPAAS